METGKERQRWAVDLGPRALYSLVRQGVVFELRLYRTLFRWVTRRPDVQGHDAEVFGYAKAVTPVMWLWIFASAVEAPGSNVYPHLLSASTLRVRHGASVDIPVPWAAIETDPAAAGDRARHLLGASGDLRL